MFASCGEGCVGRLEFPVHLLNCVRMPPLQKQEAEPGAADKGEIDHQVSERNQICRNRLADNDFLDAAYIADLPVALGALWMRVVAVDASMITGVTRRTRSAKIDREEWGTCWSGLIRKRASACFSKSSSICGGRFLN